MWKSNDTLKIYFREGEHTWEGGGAEREGESLGDSVLGVGPNAGLNSGPGDKDLSRNQESDT